MPLDSRKELTPVFYNNSGLKILYTSDTAPGRLCFEMHWHERMEFIYITDGSLNFRLGNSEMLLTAGQLAIISPEQLHYGTSGVNGVSYYTVMFDINRFNTSLPAVRTILSPIAEKRTAFLPWTRQPEIITLFESILTLTTSDDPADSLIVVGKVYQLTAMLYRFCLAREDSSPALDDRFRNVLDYINIHFAEDISSDGLSRQFGYSVGYFCRHFKKITGLSPMIYIRILRLEQAGRLLLEQELSCGEIASLCGFSDVSYFTKCFKIHFHLTPTEYARQNQRPCP